MITHPVFKLGKGQAKQDSRNLLLSAVLESTVVRGTYDFDTTHGVIPLPMFANDQYGCCVMSGRAHQTLRFELLEQKKLLNITDKMVLKEYFKETGGEDTGLVVADSLAAWRKRGWKVGTKTYKIKAYAEINRHNPVEIKRAIFSDLGVGIGLSLPLSAQKEIDEGQAWSATTDEAGSWGGHYVYVVGYNSTGPVCITWGRKQQMTWNFWLTYCDEAYAIFDAIDGKAGINSKAVKKFLKNLKK